MKQLNLHAYGAGAAFVALAWVATGVLEPAPATAVCFLAGLMGRLAYIAGRFKATDEAHR